MNFLKLLLCSFSLLLIVSCSSEDVFKCSLDNPICSSQERLTIVSLNHKTFEVTLADRHNKVLGTFKIYGNSFWSCHSRGGCKAVGDTLPFSVQYQYINKTTNKVIGIGF